VTFKGDPESSQLSDAEKKRIKRRVANRESARRVRQKRQVLMEELHCKVSLANASELPAIVDTCRRPCLPVQHLVFAMSKPNTLPEMAHAVVARAVQETSYYQGCKSPIAPAHGHLPRRPCSSIISGSMDYNVDDC